MKNTKLRKRNTINQKRANKTRKRAIHNQNLKTKETTMNNQNLKTNETTMNNNKETKKIDMLEEVLKILDKNKENKRKYSELEELRAKVHMKLTRLSWTANLEENKRMMLKSISEFPHSEDVKGFLIFLQKEKMEGGYYA